MVSKQVLYSLSCRPRWDPEEHMKTTALQKKSGSHACSEKLDSCQMYIQSHDASKPKPWFPPLIIQCQVRRCQVCTFYGWHEPRRFSSQCAECGWQWSWKLKRNCLYCWTVYYRDVLNLHSNPFKKVYCLSLTVAKSNIATINLHVP